MELNIEREVLEAESRVREHIRETPLEHSYPLSREGNCRTFLKLENLQLTHSFKLRGAVNKFLSLNEDDRHRHLVTASSGNHGSAFAYVMNRFGARGTIYLPENASPAKVETLRSYGADVRFYGDDCVKSEMFARAEAQKNGWIFVSPYNDLKIIGGQGTIGVEIQRQLDGVDAVFVPVGGGGLIAGIAGYLKSVDPGIQIVGCQPENSAVMYESVKAGEILDLPSRPTISDGSAGGIEPGAVTLDLCRHYVDDWILVREEEIIEAMRLVLEKHYLLVEGSGALSIAAFIKARRRFENRSVVCVVSGGKIALDTLRRVVCPR